MEPTEKDIVIEKTMKMSAKQVEKLIIFMTVLETVSHKIQDSDDIEIKNSRIQHGVL